MTTQKSKVLPSHASGSQAHPKSGLQIVQQGDNLLYDARLLHRDLKVKVKFEDWIRRRISYYGFEEGTDFFANLRKSTGGRRRKDYLLSIDMCKEIGMLERSAIGKQIRKAFIQAEKAARGVTQFPNQRSIFKGVKTKRINDRVMLNYPDVREKLGYKCRRSSGGEKDRYWMHFIKEGNHLYCTLEYAMHKYHSRKVYNNRKALKAMQPVLPLNFGDTAQLTTNRKGGIK